MRRMYNLLSALLFISAMPLSAMCADIVYPKGTEVTVDSDCTFFVGNENPELSLTINSEQVNIHSSGGFFHPVRLQPGENVFKIDNGKEVKVYKINRAVSPCPEAEELVEIVYNSPIIYYTNTESGISPLRSTPRDFGLNRLQHLENNIPLKIVGESGEFYHVQLARDDYAWIAKDNVKKSADNEFKPAKIESYVYSETPEKRVFTLKLSKKVPYVLSESRASKCQEDISPENYKTSDDGLDLVLYNIDGFYENKYEFHINKVGKLFGYKSYYKNNNELVIEVKKFPAIDKQNPVKGLNITIDPGHGGDEYGAVGCLGDKEKDVNLAISMKLKSILEQAGANVSMTRIDDSDVSLSERLAFSNAKNSDIFISVHNNALPDSAAFLDCSGSSVYYFYPQSKELGKYILEELVSELGLKNEGLKAQSLAVVRNTEALAVLVEVGYMIKPDDNAKLVNPEFQQNTAHAIKNGLEKFLNDI